MVDLVAGVLALIGGAFVLLAGLGSLRFRDVYARMHAATKASALGLALVGVAGLLAVDGGTAKILLAVAFVFITTPSAAHLVGRAAYRAEGVDLDLAGPDDLAALLDRELGPEDDGTPGDTTR